MVIEKYRDKFHNVATIDRTRRPAYYGCPESDHFRVTCASENNGFYIYHVSVHESLGDAREALKGISCGTFTRV